MAKPGVRSRHVIGLGLVAALALAAAPGAQALQRADVRALDALYKRSLDLNEAVTGAAADAVKASGESASLACLETLRDASSQVSDQLMDVRDVASLAARLRGAADRRRGLAAVRKAVSGAREVLPVEARQADATAKLCAADAAAQGYAHDLSGLIGDAGAELAKLAG